MIVNDGTEDMVVQLTHVKNIFAKQLPKMPKEYICRLVFDDRHKTLVLCRGAVPIGGICFREFGDRGIIEIAFCAVAAEQQVQGHGTRLMSHLKQYAVSVNVTHFFTFADNYATGYFKKQGFSKEINLPDERWRGYVKDYDGAIAMQCYVHPSIPFTQLQQVLAYQFDYVMRQ